MLAGPVISSLLWVDQQELSQAIDDDMLDILLKLDRFGISLDGRNIYRDDVVTMWGSASSDWDIFIHQKSMFDELDDYPCQIMLMMNKIDPVLSFLSSCKDFLCDQDFSIFLKFVINEIEIKSAASPEVVERAIAFLRAMVAR